nr:MAG TPA: hypothetical protein [Caudoviricetes sp.]
MILGKSVKETLHSSSIVCETLHIKIFMCRVLYIN